MSPSLLLLSIIIVIMSCSKAIEPKDYTSYPKYDGLDLGQTYTKQSTTLKVWSPVASEIILYIYENGSDGIPTEEYGMKSGDQGIWIAKLDGDYHGKYYTVKAKIGDRWMDEVAEPYARAVGVNGKRAMFVDLALTNPDGWDADIRPELIGYSDIIIYESHIRDFSIHESSGNTQKGKYLAFTETGTSTYDGLSTGIDHLQELGVTHIHLLPAFDFRSIDESKLHEPQYNWGYDPQNYNAPEGSFSTDPHDGSVRIVEFKKMIQALHKAGIRVIMDVVYNHTGFTEKSNFNQLVPGYYYRQNEVGGWSDAAACGNETASERSMMRKFMVESMVYWAREYHVDGFRVDLMGIHDIETMNEISKELNKIDPSIYVYGEGWTAGKSPLPDSARALKANAAALNDVGVFCDELRDAIKGQWNDESDLGYVSGGLGKKESLKFGIAAAINHTGIDYSRVNYSSRAWAREPWQTINYVSCHDNHTLWDKLNIANPKADMKTLERMNNLAQTIVLTSQGIPFIHSGAEFLRSKLGVENSYNAPDSINWIDWNLKGTNKSTFQYTKSLIALRKDHPAFKLQTADQLRDILQFMNTKNDHVLAFKLDGEQSGDVWKEIVVIHNGSNKAQNVDIPQGHWKVVLENHQINESGIRQVTIDAQKFALESFSSTILVRF